MANVYVKGNRLTYDQIPAAIRDFFSQPGQYYVDELTAVEKNGAALTKQGFYKRFFNHYERFESYLNKQTDVSVDICDSDQGVRVFTKDTIDKGTMIGEYVGEIKFMKDILTKDIDFSSKQFNFQYFDQDSQGDARILDASDKFNFTRFIRVVSESECANISIETTTDSQHRERRIYVASCDIMPGEELVVCVENGPFIV